jgi:hypothetical protein
VDWCGLQNSSAGHGSVPTESQTSSSAKRPLLRVGLPPFAAYEELMDQQYAHPASPARARPSNPATSSGVTTHHCRTRFAGGTGSGRGETSTSGHRGQLHRGGAASRRRTGGGLYGLTGAGRPLGTAMLFDESHLADSYDPQRPVPGATRPAVPSLATRWLPCPWQATTDCDHLWSRVAAFSRSRRNDTTRGDRFISDRQTCV